MPDTPMQEFWVARDVDRLDEHLGNSISDFLFKVSAEDSQGGLSVVEIRHHSKGGPGRHVHFDQEEWFYVLEGEYVFEVGQTRFRLKPGDSAFGPRNVPHVWAFVGDQPGRILSVITQPVGWRRFPEQWGRSTRLRRWIRPSFMPMDMSWQVRR